MKVENIDLGVERKLCTLCIMNDTVCKALLPILDKYSTKTAYARFIIDWVKEYHVKYGDSPKGGIKEIYEQKKASIRDEEVASSISNFLESLADDYDEDDYKNLKFHIDDLELYTRLNQIDAFVGKVQGARATGNATKCESIISGFTQKAIPESQGIDLLGDMNKFAEAFDESNTDPLFTLPGDLGLVTGEFFRGDLSACLSTSKAGKSWGMEGLSFAAMSCGCKVMYINLEMRDIELRQRFWRGLVNAPFTTGPVSIPFFRPDKELTEDIDDAMVSYRIDHKIVNMQGVRFDNLKQIEDTMRMRYKQGGIKLFSLPSYTTTWADIENLYNNLVHYQNWMPDVIVVDYFDILGGKEQDYRQRLNEIWLGGRKLALDKNVHVATVSQSNATGNEGKEITLDSIAEDQRKKTHVSVMYGLWAADQQRQDGYVFVKRLLGRGKPRTYDKVVVLQNLDCGIFCLDSRLASKVEGV